MKTSHLHCQLTFSRSALYPSSAETGVDSGIDNPIETRIPSLTPILCECLIISPLAHSHRPLLQYPTVLTRSSWRFRWAAIERARAKNRAAKTFLPEMLTDKVTSVRGTRPIPMGREINGRAHEIGIIVFGGKLGPVECLTTHGLSSCGRQSRHSN